MRRSITQRSILVIITVFIALICTVDAEAIKLPKIKFGGNDILEKAAKSIGIVVIINQFGSQLNDFINLILANKGATNRDATKVVPILTLGQGIEAGACQVSGPAGQVKRVKVVIAIAAAFDKGRKFQIQALVPSASLNPLKLERVYQVGISAIIDYKL